MNYKFFIIIIILTSSFGISQNIYDTKIGDCETSRFSLESEKETAKIDDSQLFKVIHNALDEDVHNKLRGLLKLQIIVYTDGSSCLLSYENDTNIDKKDLNLNQLKSLIGSELEWNQLEESVSVLLEVKFKKKKTKLFRYGMQGSLGWHRLKK
ncbi:MAG: hypothetical protein WBG46_09450 [Nonlabens sp.]